ncbi:hypothetical protein C2857_001807 [Epichloe festucae Fl1]|uniref:Uncharacterized protein n=1 Tax=Epichloe festucae (strain Fl1) TaxID=877507 RepID=A0A7S9KRK1_EPIFF|nr:hypothetical protein C2857_001807 [Epichloe festucae Fl1]
MVKLLLSGALTLLLATKAAAFGCKTHTGTIRMTAKLVTLLTAAAVEHRASTASWGSCCVHRDRGLQDEAILSSLMETFHCKCCSKGLTVLAKPAPESTTTAPEAESSSTGVSIPAL